MSIEQATTTEQPAARSILFTIREESTGDYGGEIAEGEEYTVSGCVLADGRLVTYDPQSGDMLWASVEAFAPNGGDSVVGYEIGEATEISAENLWKADRNNVAFGAESLLAESERAFATITRDADGDIMSCTLHCGDAVFAGVTIDELLARAWEAAEADYPDTIEPDGGDVNDAWVSYDTTVSLGGVEICTTRRYVLCGWIAPGASQDLNGSGLANWGDSQRGGWSVCESDGQGTEQGDPREDFWGAVREMLFAAGLGGNDDHGHFDTLQHVERPKCPEPSAEWIYEAIGEGRRDSNVLVSVGDKQARIGRVLGTPVVATEAEAVANPDADDCARLARDLLDAEAPGFAADVERVNEETDH